MAPFSHPSIGVKNHGIQKRMSASFIELERRFTLLQKNQSPDVAGYLSYGLPGALGGQWLSWSSLLENRIVIVLGEPGSGKSMEFKSLNRRIAASFLINLEQLVTENLADILSPTNLRLFERWRVGGNDEATFLLDAADEAKLRRDDDFATAIQRISRTIGSALPRARFVISSRVSEWRASTDLNIVTEALFAKPDLAGQSTESVAPLGVAVAVLLRLSTQQVLTFVEQLRMGDAQPFAEALASGNADMFAGRPLDVLYLHRYWQDHGNLSSLTALTEHMVTKLLQETANRDRSDPLSPEAARSGAEHLAAAAVMCKNLRFDIPDDGHVAEATRLSPAEILPESWQPQDRRALMNRALFDGASRGTLSFHHREHLQYLAASWIERLMARNCGFDDLKDLLFAKSDNRPTLRASLAPITAWLITAGEEPWRLRLKKLILEFAPQIHLQHGDPAALPPTYKRAVLKAMVEKYQGREFLGIHVDYASFGRLADERLVDDINGYLADVHTSVDLKCHMLMVVAKGRLAGCVPAVIDLFSVPTTTEDLRGHCLHAIQQAGIAQQRSDFAHRAQQLPVISNDVIGYIFEALYPSGMDANASLSLLGRVRDVSGYAESFPNAIADHLELATPQDALVFLRGFLDMLRIAPLNERTQRSQQYHWLSALLPGCLVCALSHSPRTVTDTNTILDAIVLIDRGIRHQDITSFRIETHSEALQHLLAQDRQLRQQLFWRRFKPVDESIALDQYPYYEVMPYQALVKWGMSDVDWLLKDIENTEHVPTQAVIFLILLRVLNSDGISSVIFAPKVWQALRVPKLRALYLRHLQELIRWPLYTRWLNYFKFNLWPRLGTRATWKRRISSRRWEWKQRWWAYCDLAVLRRGDAPDRLSDFIEVMRAGQSRTRLSFAAWDKVTEKWGNVIGSAVRQGCINAWRNFAPPLPHEGGRSTRADNRIIVGLAGLQTLWQDGKLDFTALSPAEVEHAARYACNEINGLPEWFSPLATARQRDLTLLFTEAVAAEFLYSASIEFVAGVTTKLANAATVVPLTEAVMSAAIERAEPTNCKILDQVLLGLQRLEGGNGSKIVADLAPQRIRQYSAEQAQWVAWMGAWLQVDAMPALPYLAATLDGNPEGADARMEAVCAYLFGRPGAPAHPGPPSFHSIPALTLLIPLVHRHVRRADDIDRIGKGSYSPLPRDNAQDFRYHLWETARSIESPTIIDSLRSFLTCDVLASERDMILAILDERQARFADPTPWKAIDVRTFAHSFRHEPRSNYQLFRLVSRILLDVKGEIEASENATNRHQFREGDLEKHFRGFLQKKLSDRALGWFAATQESEIDRGQRPDLRIERPGLNALPIEVKVANINWTVPQLLERLENQVVGQYLRAEQVKFAMYVIGMNEPGRTWRASDGRQIGFREVIELLKEHAVQLVERNPLTVYGLEVIGIDFTDPLPNRSTPPPDSPEGTRRTRRPGRGAGSAEQHA